MASTPEKKVKDKVVKQLKSEGAYFFYPVTGGYGTSGVPDIVCCIRGLFVGIECKAGKNKPTALQKANIDAINQAGGVAFWVNETNCEDVMQIILDVRAERRKTKE